MYPNRTSILVVLLVGVLTLASSAQKFVAAPHRPVPPKLPDSTTWHKPAVQQSMVGGPWMIDANFKSSIFLKNDVKVAPITVTPILYLSNGTKFTLKDVKLEPSGTAVVSINDALRDQNIAPWATLRGYLEIRYKFPWDAVCVTIQNVDPVHSIIFTYNLQAGIAADAQSDTTPRVLEGAWWKQESNVTGFVALSNPFEHAMPVKVQVSDDAANLLGEHSVTVSPHATKVIDLQEMKSSPVREGGIRIIYSGPEDSLLVSGGLQDAAIGYSARLPFHLPPKPDAKQTSHTYVAPGLMTGEADPMMQFPAGTRFSPYTVLRNISDQPISVLPKFYWMEGGVSRSTELQPLTVQPYHTMDMNLASLIAGSKLKTFNGTVNLALEFQSKFWGLLVASGSVDEQNTYVFEVHPQEIVESIAKSMSYWKTGDGDDTMVTVWNPADETQNFIFTLSFAGGHYRFPIHLGPKATHNFNISEVIQNQLPDDEGNVIPASIHEGSAEISGSKGGSEHIVVVFDAGTYNVRKATCGQYCFTCQGAVSGWLAANPFAVAVSNQTQLTFTIQYQDGYRYDYTSRAAWSSSAQNIATVSAGTVHGVSAGSVDMLAQDDTVPDYYHACMGLNPDFSCPQSQGFSGGGGGNVATVSCTATTRGLPTTCTVVPSGLTTTAWTFTDIYNNTVTRSNPNYSTWSGIMAIGGTVKVTISGIPTPISTSVIVGGRNWRTNPASAGEVPNGTFISLPVPPQPTGGDSGLGYFDEELGDGGFNINIINDNGPNNGYGYFATQLSYSPDYFHYEINPDLENTQSTFYQKNCGNYNPTTNPNGFIAGSTLLTQTNRHEWNSSTQSHYSHYTNSLSANNPGNYFEPQVASPTTNMAAFVASVRINLNSEYNQIFTDTKVEPYPVNDSETGQFLGNINYAPYTQCP